LTPLTSLAWADSGGISVSIIFDKIVRPSQQLEMQDFDYLNYLQVFLLKFARLIEKMAKLVSISKKLN